MTDTEIVLLPPRSPNLNANLDLPLQPRRSVTAHRPGMAGVQTDPIATST